MRTFKQVSPRAYVTKGQPEYEIYAFGPSPSPSPTVPISPPPWDGSAEGYGPEQTDFQEYYNAVDPGNPPRWGARGMGGLISGEQYAGCAGCGMGAEGGLAGIHPLLLIGGLGLLGYLLFDRKKR